MAATTPYTLTAADVMDLRLWRCQGHGALSLDGLPTNVDVPVLCVSPSDGTLYLHAAGRCVAGGCSPQAMTALLWAEALERGFCLRIADPACSIEEALWSPQDRQSAIRRRNAAEASDRARQRAADDLKAEASRRDRAQLSKQSPHDHTTLTLDDLI